jgi:hypothetical protein
MTALWDVFDGAVRVLVGGGPVKQRLIEAWRDHLASLQERDIPDVLRPRLEALRAAMYAARATGGMTAPEVSVRKMSEQEAAEHAVRVVEMYGQLAALDGDAGAQRRLRVVASPSHATEAVDDLPAFLSRA